MFDIRLRDSRLERLICRPTELFGDNVGAEDVGAVFLGCVGGECVFRPGGGEVVEDRVFAVLSAIVGLVRI